MRQALHIILFLSCVILLSSGINEKAREWVITGKAQGTTYRIVYVAPVKMLQQQEVDQLLDRLDSSISIYKPYSLITAFNKSEQGVRIDDPFCVVVKKSFEIYRATGGLSDITVKPLMDAWGFGILKSDSIPDSARVKDVLAYIGQHYIFLKGHSLKKSHPLTQIDVNGIGQGYAVDLIAGLLESKKVNNYLVELGGELRIRGKKSTGKMFKVGIGAVTNDERMQTIVSPSDGALTTSGNYINFRMNGNKKLSHIVDPKTGKPIDNEMISVTVWAKDAITADGYDNGFMAMGLTRTLQFLKKKKNIAAYIIYQKPDGTVADTASAYFWSKVKKMD